MDSTASIVLPLHTAMKTAKVKAAAVPRKSQSRPNPAENAPLPVPGMPNARATSASAPKPIACGTNRTASPAHQRPRSIGTRPTGSAWYRSTLRRFCM